MKTDPSIREPFTRVERRVRRSRRRRGRVLVAFIAVASLAAYLWVQTGHQPAKVGQSSPTVGVPVGLTKFLAFSVDGAAQPLMAMIGTTGNGKTTVLTIPMTLTMVVPGGGEMQAKDVGHLPAPVMSLALSNLVGAWANHYVVTDLDRLSALVDRIGGLNANLNQIFVLDSGAIGPGPVTLDGEQVRTLLSTPGTQAQAAWGMVLTALLTHPPVLQRSDVAGSDDLAAVQAALSRASSADVVTIPTAIVAGSTTIAAEPDLDELMTSTFGVKTLIPVVLQNGSGVAGVGGLVAQKMLPAGFRVVVSENAASFEHSSTTIIADGTKNILVAKRLRRVLGVGLVRLSRVASGISQVTVVVGKDFKV